MRRRIIATTGVVALAALAASASVAAASGTAKTGKVEVWAMPAATGATTVAHPGKVIFTGAIGDYGNVHKVNAAGKPTKKGAYGLIELKKGTILVDIAKFAAAEDKATPSIDLSTCTYFGTASGTVTFVSGTGAYKGITGSVTLTSRAGAVGALTNGKCTTKTTAPALATYTSITGSGTVTLP